MLSKEVFYYFANALLKTSALVQTNLSMLSFLQPTTMGILFPNRAVSECLGQIYCS